MSEFTKIDTILSMSYTKHSARSLYKLNEYLLSERRIQNTIKEL